MGYTTPFCALCCMPCALDGYDDDYDNDDYYDEYPSEKMCWLTRWVVVLECGELITHRSDYGISDCVGHLEPSMSSNDKWIVYANEYADKKDDDIVFGILFHQACHKIYSEQTKMTNQEIFKYFDKNYFPLVRQEESCNCQFPCWEKYNEDSQLIDPELSTTNKERIKSLTMKFSPLLIK